MTQIELTDIVDLHTKAAYAHTAAAHEHSTGDHASAQQLARMALRRSVDATRLSDQVAKKAPRTQVGAGRSPMTRSRYGATARSLEGNHSWGSSPE